MIKERYKIYYEYSGATKCDPLRQKKSDDLVERNLGYFCDDLSRSLSLEDKDASVKPESKNIEDHYIIVSVETNIALDSYNRKMKEVLNNLDLFGEKLGQN